MIDQPCRKACRSQKASASSVSARPAEARVCDNAGKNSVCRVCRGRVATRWKVLCCESPYRGVRAVAFPVDLGRPGTHQRSRKAPASRTGARPARAPGLCRRCPRPFPELPHRVSGARRYASNTAGCPQSVGQSAAIAVIARETRTFALALKASPTGKGTTAYKRATYPRCGPPKGGT
jgi:hypothetical protein